MSSQDTVEKFLEGDVIVDRKNPFKDEDDDDVNSTSEKTLVIRNNKNNDILSEYKEVIKGNNSKSNLLVSSSQCTIRNESLIKHPKQSEQIKENNYARCSNNSICTNNDILCSTSTTIFASRNPEETCSESSFIEDFRSATRLQNTSDGYASLIEVLTMENKKKRSSLKKIFPSIFSSQSKTNSKKVDGKDEGHSSKSCPSAQQPEYPESSGHENSPVDDKSRYYFDDKTKKNRINSPPKDTESIGSSTTTLVPDSLQDIAIAKTRYTKALVLKKDSVSNSPISGKNIFSSFDKQIKTDVDIPHELRDEIIISQDKLGKDRDLNKPISRIPVPNTTKDALVIIESQPSPKIEKNVYETKKSSKQSDFYFHDKNKMRNLNELPKSKVNNNREEFESLDSYMLNHAPRTFSDIVSVGAEVKISKTNVTVSPKKESEVKLRKQLRARSLSPNKNKLNRSQPAPNLGDDIKYDNAESIENYALYSVPKTAKSMASNSDQILDTAINPASQYERNNLLAPIPKTRNNPIVSHEIKIYRPVILNSVPDQLKNNPDLKSMECSEKSIDSLSDVDYQRFNQSEKETSSPMRSSIWDKTSKMPDKNADSSIIKNSPPDQKIKNLQNVEAFYWQQLKKMKYRQEQQLLTQALFTTNVDNNKVTMYSVKNDGLSYCQMPWRCRSVSPAYTRNNEPRSSSLPYFHDPNPTNCSSGVKEFTDKVDFSVVQPIPRERNINPNFVRNSPGRNTVGAIPEITIRNNPGRQFQTHSNFSTHTLPSNVQPNVNFDSEYCQPTEGKNVLLPIFKKGSLSVETMKEPIREKRVSFSSIHSSDTSKLNSVYENLSSSQITNKMESDSVARPSRNLQLFRVARSLEPTHLRSPVNQYNVSPPDVHIYGKITKNKPLEGVYATIENTNFAKQSTPQYYRRDMKFPSTDSSLNQNDDTTFKDSRLSLISGAAKNIFKKVNSARSSGSHTGASESESGSEAGEVQRIMLGGKISPGYSVHTYQEEDWNPDGKNRGDGSVTEGSRGRLARRDDPRRHTLGGDLLRAAPPHSALVRGMDIEASMPRGYAPPSSAMLFDDDPGIMSEVETASTGFRRGGKQRSSLPVVRTPSKTLERPLGLVFLQYRSETKRALLPNEITSIDTVKALFVRSFSKQLTMEYLDSPLVKIYIHDSSKDMFYELEDLRSHLRDIRDRSVLRLFESADVSGGAFPGTLGSAVALPPPGPSPSGPSNWEQDQNYFSEPEFESDYHHQHIHKSKAAVKPPAYYMGNATPSTLPRGGAIRAYSPAGGGPIPADRIKSIPGPADRILNDGYMSSPERGSRGAYEEPYYTQYVGPLRGGMTPVIDEEVTGDHPSLLDDQFSLYAPRAAARVPPYDGPRLNAHNEDVQQRMRVEHMERQLANLTGLVQKALQTPATSQPSRDFVPVASHFRTNQDKSVSFEKSVSFSDEPPDMNSPKQHSPQNSVDSKPPKPAIKSSTLPRMSSQERDRLKPVPPPKPKALVPVSGVVPVGIAPGCTSPALEYYAHLRQLHRRCKEIRSEMRNLRRMTLAQAHTMRELICDTFVKFKNATMSGGDFNFHEDSMRLAQEEEDYKQEMLKLEADLCDLENTVEHLRGSVIHRKTRVNMLDVERMALILSKSSKTVADLKVRFPSLHEGMKGMLGNEMEKVVREEKFLKEEPERLEMALRRCKKLTGTLVTLKRLASVQEQRLPCDGRMSPDLEDMELEDLRAHENSTHNKGGVRGLGESGGGAESAERSENALDALLDELQTFARPPGGEGEEEAAAASPAPGPRAAAASKPPVPERNPELLQLAARRAPPPPPPRTSSRSPLASPAAAPALSPSNSSSCDSVDSQEGARHNLLELRHQELLRKQKALQEQYARLQQLQRGGNSLAVLPPDDQNDASHAPTTSKTYETDIL